MEMLEEITEELMKLKEEYGDSVVIEKFERNVLQVKNPELSYFFATEIEGVDKKAHEQAILDSKDPKYNYMYAHDIEGADVKDHGQVIIDSNSSFWIDEFKRNIDTDDNIEEITKKILSLKSQRNN